MIDGARSIAQTDRQTDVFMALLKNFCYIIPSGAKTFKLLE